MLVRLKDVLNGEKQTKLVTNRTLKGIADNIPSALNVLLQLIYFTGPAQDVTTPDGEFHSYCWHQYMQAPYSFRSCYIVWENGYYLESAIIFRSLLERFIQTRFLYKHKELITSVWSGTKLPGKTSRKISYKDMFEDISPGYYEKWHGQQLSGFAHSKIASINFRVKYDSATKGTVIMIPEFDEVFATHIINMFCPLLFGYLNFFPIFFSSGFQSIPSDLSADYNKSTSWLQSCMNSHKQAQPKSLSWFKYIDQIINP